MSASVYPYPSISEFEPHTFGWAMDQLAAGNEVRRREWPIEVSGSWETGRNRIAIWHVYICDQHSGSMCSGFSSGACGADNDDYVGLGVDSMGYYPSDDDRAAMDWQTVDEVTADQIKYLDAHRWPHFPSCPEPARMSEQRSGNLTVALIVGVIVMFALSLIFRRYGG